MSNPFNVVSSFATNLPRPKITGETIGNELSNIVQGLPTVGGGIDIVDSTIESALSSIRNLLTNPVGTAEMALQGLRVRKVINNFFDGIDGLVRNGKLISKGNSIQLGTPEVSDSNRKPIISGTLSEQSKGNSIQSETPKVSDSNRKPIISGFNDSGTPSEQSKISNHRGHGFSYDSQGNATSSLRTTELGDINRYPSYASMEDFFKTTIGTEFYWGIKVENAENTFPNLPKPVFCDESKNYKNHNGFYFNGWLPAQQYSFSDYVTAESEEFSLGGIFELSLPKGYKLGNSLTTTLIETDARNVLQWLEEYKTYVNPSPRVVLPYKNCVYKMVIYIYRPSGSLIIKYPFYVLPNYSIGLDGSNDATAISPTITWNIVGISSPSKTEDEI